MKLCPAQQGRQKSGHTKSASRNAQNAILLNAKNRPKDMLLGGF